MPLEIGIVGVPNAGKSTIFNALTRAKAATAAYPFCTIDPNIGRVAIPDERLSVLGRMAGAEKITPAFIEFVDIAGLVRGAGRGEGLGNRFLSHIRQVDAIMLVVRCFADPEISHVLETIDPLSEVELIETELIVADMETVENRLEKVRVMQKSGDPQYRVQEQRLTEIKAGLEQGKPARTHAVDIPEDLFLLTNKPVMYCLNVADTYAAGLEQLPYSIDGLQRKAEAEGVPIVALAANLEAELSELEPDDQSLFLAEYGLEEPGLFAVIRAGKALLGLITFFTIVGTETRSWVIPEHTPAPQAAGKIHSDMERGFIAAEVIAFDVLASCGSYNEARAKGQVRQEGKDYPIREGDVVLFRFNV